MVDLPIPKPTANKPLENPCLSALIAWQAERLVAPPSLLAVAFSGGADSSALLFAAQQLWPDHVLAVHIHHGLQAAADDFAQHCQNVCDQINIPLHIIKVDARAATKESPEDAARKARYAALVSFAQENKIEHILLAQHGDDQVETILLALSRGAGLPGISGMAAYFERAGVQFERPLLGVSSLQLRQWLQVQNLAYVDDPTNLDVAYTRNRIRHTLLPALAKNFAQYRQTFSRSARHAAQAQSLLNEIAEQDLSETDCPPVIKKIQKLSGTRQTNLLRFWLKKHHQTSPSEAQLAQLQTQIAACTTRGHRIHIKVGAGFVQRQGDYLDWYNPSAAKPNFVSEI